MQTPRAATENKHVEALAEDSFERSSRRGSSERPVKQKEERQSPPFKGLVCHRALQDAPSARALLRSCARMVLGFREKHCRSAWKSGAGFTGGPSEGHSTS